MIRPSEGPSVLTFGDILLTVRSSAAPHAPRGQREGRAGARGGHIPPARRSTGAIPARGPHLVELRNPPGGHRQRDVMKGPYIVLTALWRATCDVNQGSAMWTGFERMTR